MKCILLSAGLGKRLLPYTKNLPKCLIDLGGENLIEIWLKKVNQLDFDEIIINSHHLNDILEHQIFKISEKLKIDNIKIIHEKELLGTAGTLWSLQKEINDDFFVINTDVYAEVDLKKMQQTFQENFFDCLIAYDFRRDTYGCGIIKLSKNYFLEKFIEKDHNNKPGYVYSGILIFSKKIFEKLPFSKYSRNNFKGLDTGHHVLPQILKTTQGFEVSGKVIDLRDAQKLLEMREYYTNQIKLD
ncbi:nucleotidyltransferase family protein [Pelagibacteraceae bacterium]|nr:nucleotidyltransferase family protein [Pelagibacteraceae bacterium]